MPLELGLDKDGFINCLELPLCSLQQMNESESYKQKYEELNLVKKSKNWWYKILYSELLFGFNYKIMIINSIRQIDNPFIPPSFHWNELHIKFWLAGTLIIHDCYNKWSVNIGDE